MSPLTIDRVTLRTQDSGAQARARQRRALGRLERCDPSAPGGPPEVLVLRRLADPVPGALGRSAGQDGQAVWERGLDAALTVARARAVRPGRGVPLDAADAVLFADEVEMLACLAERLAAGRGPAWWAQVLVSRLPPGAGVVEVMALKLHLMPALVAALVARGTVLAVLARLTEAQAGRLTAALAGVHTSDLAPPPELAQPENPDPARSAVRPRPEEELAILRSLPDLSAALVQVLRGLSPAAALLLATAWLRRHRPALTGARLVHGGARLRALAVLRAGVNTPRLPGEFAARSPDSAHDPAPPAAAEDHAGPDAPLTGSALPHPAPRPGATEQALQAMPWPGAEPTRAPHPSADQPIGLTEAANADLAEASVPDLGMQTASALGGVFFLINLFVGGIPARAPDLAAAIAAAGRADDGAWTALERLARAHLSDDDPTPALTEADPLWRLLAQLDGRPSDRPVAPAHADQEAARTARQWLIQAAWGRDPATGAAAEVSALLRRPALIFAAPLHLDVVFGTETASLPVRRAGLDLDPGWQPRFGRIIAFHYREGGLS